MIRSTCWPACSAVIARWFSYSLVGAIIGVFTSPKRMLVTCTPSERASRARIRPQVSIADLEAR
jgi:hypothetical protein